MRGTKEIIKNRQGFVSWFVFVTGLAVMALGFVLLIKAGLGSAPWDVLHIGLYEQFGLTIGTWSILVGFFIIFVAFLLTNRAPRAGTFFNMVLVGIFIDLYLGFAEQLVQTIIFADRDVISIFKM